jgi:hypothetical protein
MKPFGAGASTMRPLHFGFKKDIGCRRVRQRETLIALANPMAQIFTANLAGASKFW